MREHTIGLDFNLEQSLIGTTVNSREAYRLRCYELSRKDREEEKKG